MTAFGTPVVLGGTNSASGTGITLPVGTAMGSGVQAILVVMSSNGAPGDLPATTNPVVDTKGNVYQPITSAPFTANSRGCWAYLALDATPLGLTDTIPCTWAGSTTAHAAIAIALPGVAAVAALDQVFTPGHNNSNAPLAAIPNALGWGQELALAVEVNRGTAGTPTWAAGWNPLDTVGSATGFYTSVAYQVTSGPVASLTASASLGGSVAWSMLGLTLLPAAYLVGSNSIASGATLTIPVTTSTSDGETIVVGGSTNGHALIQSVTDTQGNQYKPGPVNTGSPAASSFYAPDAVALTDGTDEIFVTYSGVTAPKQALAVAVPGADPVAPVDQQPGTGGNSTTPAITSGPLARPVEIAVAIEANGTNGGACTWAAGWTSLAALPGGSGTQFTGMAYMPVNSEAPLTASATITSAAWSMLLLTLAGPSLPTGAPGRPVRAVKQPPESSGRIRRVNAPWFGTGPAVKPRRGPVSPRHHRPDPAQRYGRVVRPRGAAAVTLPPASGPPIKPPTGPVRNWGRRPGPRRFGRIRRGQGAPWTAPPTVDVTKAWVGSRAIVDGFSYDAPMIGSLDVPIDSDGSKWLIAFCTQTLPDGYLGSTLGVADDVHGTWTPLGAPNGTSDESGYTRCSIWARPSPGTGNPWPATSHIYVYPTGEPNPIYPAVISCTVIEVTGMSPYLGLPAVVTASANQVSQIATDVGTPTAQVLMLAVAASDGAPFASGPGAGWNSLPGVSVANTAPAILSTSVAWQTSTVDQPCAWTVASGQGPDNTTNIGDLSACVAAILIEVEGPPQPNPNWPVTQLLFGFGSGASTPLDQVQWTDLTDRLEGATETSTTRGKQYQLDQTQAGQITLTLDNRDSYLSPDNPASPFAGLIVADTPVTLQMTWQGRTYSVFSGYIARIPQNWTSATRRGLVQLTIVDSWSLLNAQLNSCQQSEILASAPAYYWTCGDAAGSVYAQNAAPGNPAPLIAAESKGGFGSSAAAFGADSGVNPGDPDGSVWSQTGLTTGQTGQGAVLACQDQAGNFPDLATDGMVIMGWFDPVATTQTGVVIGSGSTVWDSFTTSFSNGDALVLLPTGGGTEIPGGFTAGKVYYVVNASGSTWALASSPGGTAIKATSNGSCFAFTGQPGGENLYLMKGANNATGDAFALMLGYTNNEVAGGLYMRVYDKKTRQTTNTLVSNVNWLQGGNTHFTLLLTDKTWQVILDGGDFPGASGVCNLPETINWLSFIGSADRFYTGGIFNCTAGHIAVFPRLLPSNRITQIVIAGFPVADGGQFPEPPNRRIERLLNYGGWAGPRAISTSSPTVMAPISDIQGSPGHVSASGQVSASGGQQVSQAVTNIVVSDNGMCYVDGAGVLCYISRRDLYGQQPVWLLGELTTEGEAPVEGDVTFGYDKSLLSNVAQLTPSTGNGTPVIAQNNESVDQHSVTEYTATVYQAELDATIDEANWIVNTKGEPANRLETATVNAAANPANWLFVLGAEPGQAVQATRRPITASQPTTVQAVLVQVKRTFNFKAGQASAQVVTDTFPEGSVLIAGDPTYGQLDGLNRLAW